MPPTSCPECLDPEQATITVAGSVIVALIAAGGVAFQTLLEIKDEHGNVT